MNKLRTYGLSAGLLLIFACLYTQHVEAFGADDERVLRIELRPDQGERWHVRFEFPEPQDALIFSRSSGDYRVSRWRALTPGVVLERVDGFDFVSSIEPRTAFEFSFTPYSVGIPKDYTPFIEFSDGGQAIYTGQFELVPVKDRQAVVDLNGDVRQWLGEQLPLNVVIRSNETMILDGQIYSGQVESTTHYGGTYVYVGSAEVQTGRDYVGVIDPGLPDWLGQRFEGDLARVFAAHRTRWGQGLPSAATVYFAFRGYDHPGFSNKGGASGLLLALEASGQDLKKFNERMLVYFYWFFAHEVAHLFQLRDGLEFSADSPWLHEGSANTMAIRVLDDMGVVSESYINGEYRRAYASCVKSLNNGSLYDAGLRGEYDAFYDCGDLIAQASDAAIPGRDIFHIWNTFLTEAAQVDQLQDAAVLYFETLKQMGASEAFVEQVKTIVETELGNPEAALQGLFNTAGLQISFDDKGEVSRFVLPK